MLDAVLRLVLAASLFSAGASEDVLPQSDLDTSEADALLGRDFEAVMADGEPERQAELAARLAPKLEAEASRGTPRRRASVWLAVSELHAIISRRAVAHARELDSVWVAEKEALRDCQVPTDPEDDWTRIDLMARVLDSREAAFECAVQRAPGTADFWFSLGEAQSYRLRISDAVRSMTRGLELEPANQAGFTAVALRARLGDYDGAVAAADALHAAIVRSPARTSMIGMEGQAALVRVAARLRAGRRADAAAVWRQKAWLIGRGEFCMAQVDGELVEASGCEAPPGDFPSAGSVQAWGKFASGPLDALESKCDRGWKVLVSAGARRVVPRTYWLPEEEGAVDAALTDGSTGRWLLKMCSGSNSLAVHLLPAGAPLSPDARAAAAAAPHVVQQLVEPVWLTPGGHKGDMRVHVLVAASTTRDWCWASARPARHGTLGASRIWVSRRGMLRVAPKPHDPTLSDRAALVTSNPRHGRIRDPGAGWLWDNLAPEAADALHGRIRAVVGEVVRAAGYEPLGDGTSAAAEASLYCHCEFVPQYTIYGFDVIFEKRDGGLVPWVLEATYAPDMRSDYARNHSAAALHALREALEAREDEPAEALQQLREHCAADLGCAGEAQLALCARSLLDLQRERRHLSELLLLYHPETDDVADERLADEPRAA